MFVQPIDTSRLFVLLPSGELDLRYSSFQPLSFSINRFPQIGMNTCVTSPDPDPALPCRAFPALPNLALPCLASPRLASPALPNQT